MRPPYKVWIEISQRAVRKNIRTFRTMLGRGTKLYAVVKSNAYGHGLTAFSGIADACDVDGFCVDSVVEGEKLRLHGITKPILVLGHTLPALHSRAASHGIAVTISNREALAAWAKARHKPDFHVKIDTGMHRQGFQAADLPVLLRTCRSAGLRADFAAHFKGAYTHFAMAKNRRDTAFTDTQLAVFQSACDSFAVAGFSGFVRHASATGGTLLGEQYRLDIARVGIGLYGIWPSAELEEQLSGKIALAPVLSLKAVVSEVKTVGKGEGIGYDLTERVARDSKIAIVPIGYWHGIPRAVSSRGRARIGSHHARIIGRVSMDMVMLDVTDVPCRIGSVVSFSPVDLAQAADASPYEVVTRINPLIHKEII